MSNDDPAGSVDEIQSLRRQGTITPQEAYRRHSEALSRQSPGALPQGDSGARSTSAAVGEGRGPTRLALDLVAITVAILGGVIGVLGAFVQEFQAGGGILLLFASAAIIEEALKPAGIYLLLACWPQALRGRLHIAMLTGLSGLSFGLVESLVYVLLYFPEGGDDYVLFRFTVPVAMHAFASFIVGLGLSRNLVDWAAGRASLSKSTRSFYLAGVAVHAAYNISVVILRVAGVFDFD